MIYKFLGNGDKKHLARCFLFFFAIAICSYLALIVSSSPYNDDYVRYTKNYQVGTMVYCRGATSILEFLLFWAPTSYDASPFFMVLSCALLACVALMCGKILDTMSGARNTTLSDPTSRWCFVPVVVNPYLASCMIFRFDNPFMMLSMLCATGAAYVSTLEQYRSDLINISKLRWMLIQVCMLLLCLFIYQTAISAYLTVFAYVLLLNLSRDMPIRQIILETRHWFRNILVTLVIYLPIITSAGTKKVKSIFHEVLPESFSEITNDILGNIYLYFHGLYFDWSCNAVGVIFFLVLVVFFASFVIDAWKNRKL